MWLLKTELLQGMRLAHARGREATADERRDFEAHAQIVAAAPKNLTVAGGVAQIDISGVLTEKPDFLAWLFGGANTTYESTRASLAAAEADPAIKQIVLNVNSPGGSVNGLFETLAAIEATTKPMRVRASLAASAAYAIAASAGRIEAVGPASSFGSIGVAASIYVDPEVVDIASTEAPNKRPDVTTDEGKAVIREELDAIHELFADAIARGRAAATGSDDIDVEFVNANFGRGGSLLAAEAKKRKMIDSYPKPAGRAASRTSASAGDGGANIVTEKEDLKPMTKDQLKAAHPETYAAILEEGRKAGEAEGIKAGASQERDRVNAHLTMGQASGDMKTALAAVESGEPMTQTLQAKYFAAGMNRKDRDAKQEDSDAAAAAADGAAGASASATAEGDPADRVADIVCGKKESK